MSEFKVGDKVRAKADSAWGERGSGLGTRSITWGGDLKVTAAHANPPAVTVDGAGYFLDTSLELVSPQIQVGDTVVVATTGVVDEVSDQFVYVTNGYGKYHFSRAAHSIEAVKKAEPVYEAGQLYRDAEGGLFYRTDEEEWLWLPQGGDYTFSQEPTAPLTVAEIVEPPF